MGVVFFCSTPLCPWISHSKLLHSGMSDFEDNCFDDSDASENREDAVAEVKIVKKTSSNIRIYPPSVEFEGIEPGILYVLTISIQNITHAVRRMRIIPPATPHFVLNYVPTGSIAPGLDIKAEVEF